MAERVYVRKSSTVTTPKLEPEIEAAKSRIPSRVRVTTYSWGRWIEGRRDDLIAEGFAQADWLCNGSERDRFGRTVRQKKLVVDGRKVETTHVRGDHYKMRHYFNATEEAAYNEAAGESTSDRALELALDREKRAMGMLPDSIEQYRKNMMAALEIAVNVVSNAMHASGGYAFDIDTQEEIENAIGNAFWTGKRARTVTFSTKARARQMLAIKLVTARVNAPLQGMLKRMVEAVQTGRVIKGARVGADA